MQSNPESSEEKEARLLAALNEHGSVRLDQRPQLGYWQDAIESLVQKKLATTEFVDLPEEQYSYYSVKKVET